MHSKTPKHACHKHPKTFRSALNKIVGRSSRPPTPGPPRPRSRLIIDSLTRVAPFSFSISLQTYDHHHCKFIFNYMYKKKIFDTFTSDCKLYNVIFQFVYTFLIFTHNNVQATFLEIKLLSNISIMQKTL